MRFRSGDWGLVLGGSSGIGLATARKLAHHGMSLCVVHRDRKTNLPKIQEQFAAIRADAPGFVSFNVNALDPTAINHVLEGLRNAIGTEGRVRSVIHAIAAGDLRPLNVRRPKRGHDQAAQALAADAGPVKDRMESLERESSRSQGTDIPGRQEPEALDDQDLSRTIYNMGASLYTWVRELRNAQLFAEDVRVISLTSEGSSVVLPNYAAVSAAKAVLESLSRAIAVEFACEGIRANVVQAGVTDTAALRAIPGHEHLREDTMRRNPFGRLTTPEDVANVISLLCTDEAAWINGAVIRADGGEFVSRI